MTVIEPTSKAPWTARTWVTVIAVALVLLFAAFALISGPSPDRHPHVSTTSEDRRVCSDLATVAVYESAGRYTIGGAQWRDMIASCLVDRELDRR